MSLRSTIVLILLGVFFLYLGFYYGIQRFIIFPSFVALEQEETKKDIDRCVEALRREIHHLDAFTYDWAAWDDTYQFVEDRNTFYIESNLVLDTFIDSSLNLIYICNLKGEVVWGEVRDLKTMEVIQLRDFPQNALLQTHPLRAHKSLESSIAGILMTERGPMLVASRPILTSNNEGPIRGTVIMGRFLGADLIKTLEAQTRVTFQLWPVNNRGIPLNEKEALAHITASHPVFVEESNDDYLHVYTTYPDILGAPGLLLRVEAPRDITRRGTNALVFATFSIIAAGVILFMAMWLLLRKIVTDSITKLTHNIVAIGEKKDFSSRLSVKRNDEIGILSNEFNRMLQKLSEARRKLLEQSYYSGMAEMTTEVLHNLRNSLNPIVGYLHSLRQDLNKVPLEEIEIAQKELSEGKCSEERKNDLTHYLHLSYQNLFALLRKVRGTLESLSIKVTEIEDALAFRDKFGTIRHLIERLELGSIVKDAIAMIPAELGGTVSFEIDARMNSIGSVLAHRIPLLEIITNILNNAVESIRRAGSVNGKVQINAEVEKGDGADMVHVWICDNGEGISPENLKRIFERNFSTKRDGTSLFGLHWCANAIAAMKGRIYAESKGKGHGACFHLLIPKNL